MSDNPTQSRLLHFSIEGAAMMNIAREKFYCENDFTKAIDILLSCLVTDQISDGDRLAIAMKILDGRMEMVGTYPIDFDVMDRDEKDPRYDIKTHFEEVNRKTEDLKSQLEDARETIAFIGEQLDSWQLSSIDREARHALGHKIFGTEDEGPSSLLDGIASPLVQELLETQEFARENPEESANDYGWLGPDGTFYPVEFAEHVTWAEKRVKMLRDMAESEETRRHIDAVRPDDYLRLLGWALIHNPFMGIGQVSKDPQVVLTDRQCAFLFDYYTKRGKHGMASKYVTPGD